VGTSPPRQHFIREEQRQRSAVQAPISVQEVVLASQHGVDGAPVTVSLSSPSKGAARLGSAPYTVRLTSGTAETATSPLAPLAEHRGVTTGVQGPPLHASHATVIQQAASGSWQLPLRAPHQRGVVGHAADSGQQRAAAHLMHDGVDVSDQHGEVRRGSWPSPSATRYLRHGDGLGNVPGRHREHLHGDDSDVDGSKVVSIGSSLSPGWTSTGNGAQAGPGTSLAHTWDDAPMSHSRPHQDGPARSTRERASATDHPRHGVTAVKVVPDPWLPSEEGPSQRLDEGMSRLHVKQDSPAPRDHAHEIGSRAEQGTRSQGDGAARTYQVHERGSRPLAAAGHRGRGSVGPLLSSLPVRDPPSTTHEPTSDLGGSIADVKPLAHVAHASSGRARRVWTAEETRRRFFAAAGATESSVSGVSSSHRRSLGRQHPSPASDPQVASPGEGGASSTRSAGSFLSTPATPTATGHGDWSPTGAAAAAAAGAGAGAGAGAAGSTITARSTYSSHRAVEDVLLADSGTPLTRARQHGVNVPGHLHPVRWFTCLLCPCTPAPIRCASCLVYQAARAWTPRLAVGCAGG
jgi:hypothetical protein